MSCNSDQDRSRTLCRGPLIALFSRGFARAGQLRERALTEAVGRRPRAWSMAVCTGLMAFGPPFARALAAADRPLSVVASVDLARYAGTWYEVARLPNRFQDHCAGDVRATYVLRPDGRITVANQCRTSDGGIDRAEGVARLADEKGSTAKLKVRFAPAWLSWLPMVWGDYQIMELAPDYSHVLVGTPDRAYLWILARTPGLDEATRLRLTEAAARQGFDVRPMIQTQHTK
jgi:apolipoprotein D and lipocalin family protein